MVMKMKNENHLGLYFQMEKNARESRTVMIMMMMIRREKLPHGKRFSYNQHFIKDDGFIGR